MGIFESACRHCGSKEHASEDCPHGIFSTECQHCGSKNHASDDCPHGIFSKECRHCGSIDHSSDDCPHGIFSEECCHCGSKNHASDDCPHGIFSKECRHCGSKDHATNDCPHGPFATPRREAPQTVSHDDSSGGDGLVQLVVGLAVVVFVIWFITSIAIPLVVINMASIALVAGAVKKNWSKVLFPVAFLGAIIVVADYNLGWATNVLSSNVAFFRSWIKPLLYINLFAGLLAAYLSIRHVLNTRKPPPVGASELSRRNLITISCLLGLGGAVISVQQHVDANANHSSMLTKSQVQSSPPVSPPSFNEAQRLATDANNPSISHCSIYVDGQRLDAVAPQHTKYLTPYKGGCQHGLAEGQGIIEFSTLVEGRYQEVVNVNGQFHRGKLHGQATVKYAVKNENGVIWKTYRVSGEYRDGQPWTTISRESVVGGESLVVRTHEGKIVGQCSNPEVGAPPGVVCTDDLKTLLSTP